MPALPGPPPTATDPVAPPRRGRGRWATAALGLALGLGIGVGAAARAPEVAAAPRAQPEPAAGRVYVPFVVRAAALADLPRPTGASVEPTAAPSATPEAPTATEPPAPTPTPTKAAPDYDEPLSDLASIDDLRAGYDPSRWYETMLTLLERRYATGRHIVVSLADSRARAEVWTAGQRDTFDGLLRALQVAVHEMNHQLGFQEGILATRFERYAYVVRADETRLVPDIDTFPRSEIAVYITGPLENQYKATYLTGRSGDQNFNTLLDEFNAYTHSLFVGYGIHDQLRGRSSYRDGLVTMMLYVEFFLRHARQNHPADYAALRAAPEMRAVVDLLWRRAEFILRVSEDLDVLRYDPDAVEAAMRAPEMVDEVRRFVVEGE